MASTFEALLLAQVAILMPNGPTWQAYTPTWTQSGASPAIGNGTITGAYIKIGRTVLGRIEIAFGSTTNFGSGTNPWIFSLPLTPTVPAANLRSIGSWSGLPSTTFYAGNAYMNTGGAMGLIVSGSSSSVETTNPATWTSTGYLEISFQYETTA